ncbi:hypothetical protein TSTA_008760, partial [Talaromyces stipitatus ATCC 10500]
VSRTRAMAIDLERKQSFEPKLQSTITKYGIPTEDIYTILTRLALQVGMGRDQYIVTRELKKRIYIPLNTNREYITVVEGVNASSEWVISPFVIIAAKTIIQGWFDATGYGQNIGIAVSGNGYPDDELGYQWIHRETFRKVKGWPNIDCQFVMDLALTLLPNPWARLVRTNPDYPTVARYKALAREPWQRHPLAAATIICGNCFGEGCRSRTYGLVNQRRWVPNGGPKDSRYHFSYPPPGKAASSAQLCEQDEKRRQKFHRLLRLFVTEKLTQSTVKLLLGERPLGEIGIDISLRAKEAGGNRWQFHLPASDNPIRHYVKVELAKAFRKRLIKGPKVYALMEYNPLLNKTSSRDSKDALPSALREYADVFSPQNEGQSTLSVVMGRAVISKRTSRKASSDRQKVQLHHRSYSYQRRTDLTKSPLRASVRYPSSLIDKAVGSTPTPLTKTITTNYRGSCKAFALRTAPILGNPFKNHPTHPRDRTPEASLASG